MKDYRKPFQITLGLSIVLAAVVAFIGWRYVAQGRRGAESREMTSPAPAAGEAPAPESSPAAAATPLAPLQLSPQRLKSIGVTSGEVEVREIANEIRAVGNVAV